MIVFWLTYTHVKHGILGYRIYNMVCPCSYGINNTTATFKPLITKQVPLVTQQMASKNHMTKLQLKDTLYKIKWGIGTKI